ncbi:MAG: 50S ribosomal protein L25 [bacterium]
MIKIVVEKRNTKDTPDFLRANGKVPAVFYGKKEASTPVAVSMSEFKKVWREAGETSIIELVGEGIDVQALIYKVDLNALTEQPVHIDFYAIEKDKKLEIDIPLVFTGAAPAVRDLGGVLVKVMHEVKVEALPKDLPKEISVDLSALTTMESQILAKDLTLPTGVSLVVDSEAVVAAITKLEEEKVEAAPVDLSAIEVAKKGKDAKEGTEGAEAPATEVKK